MGLREALLRKQGNTGNKPTELQMKTDATDVPFQPSRPLGASQLSHLAAPGPCSPHQPPWIFSEGPKGKERGSNSPFCPTGKRLGRRGLGPIFSEAIANREDQKFPPAAKDGVRYTQFVRLLNSYSSACYQWTTGEVRRTA